MSGYGSVWRRGGQGWLLALVVSCLVVVCQPAATASAASGPDLALHRSVVASSVQSSTYSASHAVDGSLSTLWTSASSDPQWIYVDLGTKYKVNEVVLNWSQAYATAYQIQVSSDATHWTTIYSTSAGNGGVDDVTGLSGSGRYVRIYATKRNTTTAGYSLWELSVYGTALDLALNHSVVASSAPSSAYPASAAVDGSLSTRWSSAASDPQWIYVDLGSAYNLNEVVLNWGQAYASSYQIQVSSDATHWATIYSTTTGTGGVSDLTGLVGTGRYVRMYGTKRSSTTAGYALWELAVYGTPSVADPSGVAMPVGDVTGWHQVFADNFANLTAPLGSFSGCTKGATPVTSTCSGLSSFPSVYQKWWAYPDGWPDQFSGTYYPTKVMSVADGVMTLHVHTATVNGTAYHMVSAPVPKIPGGINSDGLLYGRYIVRFRMDPLPGYKIAFMLWPDSGNQPKDGEIDFPEDNKYGYICAFMHWRNATSSGDEDKYCSTATASSGWHTAETDWTATACTFKLDGTVLGSSTNTSRIPDTPFHWVLQTQTSSYGVIPSNSTVGNVQIDWVTAYTPT